MDARTPRTAAEVADMVGRGNIAAAVGVGLTAVSNAVARDKRFPPSWYLALAKLASDRGFTLAPELCGMKGANQTIVPQPVDNVNGAQ